MSRKTVLKKLDAIGFDELNDFLAETVHTSFRKGCDGGGSDEVWSAIRKMDPAQWDGAIKWMVWALRVSTGREERTVSNVVSLDVGREVIAESNGHHWIKAFNLTCCRDCGNVRRADDQNSPCKGTVRVGPRMLTPHDGNGAPHTPTDGKRGACPLCGVRYGHERTCAHAPHEGPVTTEQLDKLQFGRSLHKRPDSEREKS
jgi:hypothetical protein